MYTLKLRPISYNTYYRIFRNRFVISDAGRQFRNNVIQALKDINPICYDKPVKMTIIMHFKTKKELDIDNCLKAVIDALKGILYKDDKLIYTLNVEKHIDQEEDLIKVGIEPRDNTE